GLVTTDSYRIGGHDQLRLYGQILGVQVHCARDAEELAAVLERLQHKHLILIDTVGMSQRDRLVSEQVAMLRSQGQSVRRRARDHRQLPHRRPRPAQALRADSWSAGALCPGC
ncbi:hypothetical protein, partial [Streptococcus pneumoniae]|uniref:hypothetical protein n=1 Tax=Streptococcus pneumoniae TaxID=1313 RepID=UPI00125292CE